VAAQLAGEMAWLWRGKPVLPLACGIDNQAYSKFSEGVAVFSELKF